jgi:hypothetical protein
MEARAEFDATELAIMTELERRIGSYRNVMMITREQYNRHLAGTQVPIARSEGWLHEQRQRSVYARSILEPPLRAAREDLARKTLTALSSFFERERKAGRISKRDYRRYTVEIRRGEFPGFRPRKWSGPPIYEFRGVMDVGPEYRKTLQEVRRLWQAQGRNASAMVWTAANPSFYSTLVPPKRQLGQK